MLLYLATRSLAHYTLQPSPQRHRLSGLHRAPPTMDWSKDLNNIPMFSSNSYMLRRPAKHQVVPVAYVFQTSGALLPPNGCAACSPKTRPIVGPPKKSFAQVRNLFCYHMSRATSWVGISYRVLPLSCGTQRFFIHIFFLAAFFVRVCFLPAVVLRNPFGLTF